MLRFSIDDVVAKMRKALVNEELGVEKGAEFYIHETLVRQYLKSVLTVTENALRETLLQLPVERLKETAAEAAYRGIYDWHKKNAGLIYAIYGGRDKYSKTYRKLVDLLPEPRQATEEDMLFVANQVLGMLMQWAYDQGDEYGIKMHEYAKIIETELKDRGIDMKSSRLNAVLEEFEGEISWSPAQSGRFA